MDKTIKQQLISPANPGGAPLFAEDMVRLQEHAKTLSIPMLQHSADIAGHKLPVFSGSQQIGTTKAGLFITPPSFTISSDNNVIASVAVSEFTAFIDGKMCVYNGGTMDFRSMTLNSHDGYFVEVGNELKETRIFRDGVNRDLLITHEVKLTRVPYSVVYGEPSLGSAYLDAHGVFLAARYNESETDPANEYFPLKHPNCAWDTMGLNTPISKAMNAVSKSESNVSSWVEITFSDATGYTKGTGTVEVREESLTGLLRLRGSVSYNVTSSTTQLIGSFPAGKRPDFNQIVGHVHTDTDENGYLEFKANGEIWATINVGGGQNNATLLFDGVAFPGR